MKPWPITLPMFQPAEVLDNSTVTEYSRCPRRGLYRYGLRRGFTGKSWTIQFGLAYHKYRETVTNLCREQGVKIITDAINQAAFEVATLDWEDPPFDHRYAYLDKIRLIQTMALARARIEQEQRTGSIEVLRAEDSFDVPVPFYICKICGWSHPGEASFCHTCGETQAKNEFLHARHGGRIDEFVIYHTIGDKLMIRDFKTTGYMTYNYTEKFDPNSALQGYVFEASQLSGQNFDGALIETVYNTKTQGPKISQHYVTYSKGQQEQWLASYMMERQFIQTMWARVDELGYLAFPQRTDACNDFGGCMFRDACRTGGAYELNNWLDQNTVYSEWDFTNPSIEVATE